MLDWVTQSSHILGTLSHTIQKLLPLLKSNIIWERVLENK